MILLIIMFIMFIILIILIIIIIIIIMMGTQVSPEEREFFVGELTNYIYLLAAPPLLLFLMVALTD